MTINIEQEARRYARIVVTAMQSGYQGLYDARTETIYIADNLTPTQYRCVLAHEVSHAKHQRADVEAARMLISQADYVTAEILYGNDECAIARELNVMPWIIRAYKNWLHDSVAA